MPDEAPRGGGGGGGGGGVENRFEAAWREWDEAMREGKAPPELLAAIPSEKILQLLAGAGKTRRYERDILATEAMNRLLRARHRLDEAAGEVKELMEEMEARARQTARDVHEAEREVEALPTTGGADESVHEMTVHRASRLVDELVGLIAAARSSLDRLEAARHREVAHALGPAGDGREAPRKADADG